MKLNFKILWTRLNSKFLKILLIIILVISLLEIYFRLFQHEKLKTQTVVTCYIPDSLAGFNYQPNATVCIDVPSVTKTFRFNNHGYYGYDFETKKADSVFRICIVGRSDEAAIKSDGDKNWAMLLQDRYTKNKDRVEIINCSKDDGWRDLRELDDLETNLVNFEPDVVLLFKYPPLRDRFLVRDQYKDIFIRYHESYIDSVSVVTDVLDEKVFNRKFLTGLYDKSYLVRALCRFYYKNTGSVVTWAKDHICTDRFIFAYATKEYSPEDQWDKYHVEYGVDSTVTIIRNLSDSLNKKGIKLVIAEKFVEPVWKEYTRKLDSLNIPNLCLDIEYSDSLTLKYDEHSSFFAHQIYAERFYTLFDEEKLIPEEYLNKSK